MHKIILLLAAAAWVSQVAAAPAGTAEEATPALKMSSALTTAAIAHASAAARQVARPGMKDYRIGAEDLLEIQVFGVEQLSRAVRVNSRGIVTLPLIGPVEVAGMTAQEAEAAIAALLAGNFLQNPQVSLFIKEYTSQRVTIEGAVNKPGIYPLRGQTTLLRSLAVAGGQASLSDMSEVMLFREDASGKREALVFDVDRIRRGELEDPVVVNDDLIVVNRSRTRTMLKDSILRDVIETINPFRWGP